MQLTSKKQKTLLDRIDLFPLSFLVLSAGAIELRMDGCLWQTLTSTALATVIGLATVAYKTNWLKSYRLKHFIQKEGVMPVIGLILLVGMTLGFMLVPDAAHAQMFFDVETAITGAITTATGGSAADSGTTFNTLVALMFTFYRVVLAIGIIGVIVKIGIQMREEQEWKDTMKIPMLIFALLTVGDFTLGFILGI